MPSTAIRRIEARDLRFPLRAGAGSDAVHSGAEYAFAVTRIYTDGAADGTGIALTLGPGNELVAGAIAALSHSLVGKEIGELMAGFGAAQRALADHPQLRWLGPHKGATHLALASLTNACFDLWAKAEGLPLWRLLLNLSPERIACLLDLSYLEDVLTRAEALEILCREAEHRPARLAELAAGFPAYDTSVGWYQYDDRRIRECARRARGEGFRAVKLKVGSPEGSRDIRRAAMLREVLGRDALLMLDANQQWTLPRAVEMCRALAAVAPYWIEEPTHPDDVLAHCTLAREIAPIPLAAGEHIPNRVVFKNFMQAAALGFVQADCTRLAGVSEFLTVSLLARKFGLPVAPHVGDMGQIHQHLVLFNRVALGHSTQFLEYIPHLRHAFVHPAEVRGGRYLLPQTPGASCDLVAAAP